MEIVCYFVSFCCCQLNSNNRVKSDFLSLNFRSNYYKLHCSHSWYLIACFIISTSSSSFCCCIQIKHLSNWKREKQGEAEKITNWLHLHILVALHGHSKTPMFIILIYFDDCMIKYLLCVCVCVLFVSYAHERMYLNDFFYT